jgi:asparagine synthase (glutamine-hydrolysing)
LGSLLNEEIDMSAQAGIWNFDGRPVDRKLLGNLNDALRQQGPDGESYYVDNSIALLYRPFHTTAESRQEKQPYASRRGFILTWDGRLDNRDDLIADLHSDLEAGLTDAAIVSAAFDRWEADCFRRIVGDWAVSVWKPEQRELLFASDYMAIRHIFYYLKSDRVLWSTDLAPLVLLSDDTFNIDDDFIGGYFANDPDSDRTPYRRIHQVAAGHFVRVRNHSHAAHRYWLPSLQSRLRYKTDTQYEEHFRYVFRSAVRRRLRSDSPILAELSGGLDSSSIVCMADDILAKEGARARRLDTLSYFDQSEPHADDMIYSQKVEEKRGRIGVHLGITKVHDSALLQPERFCELPGCLEISQQLDVERAAVVRSGGYRAVLSGTGGDEFLGGVPNPTALLADLVVQLQLVTLAKQLMSWSLVKRCPWLHLLWQSTIELLPASLAQYFLKRGKVVPWLGKAFARRAKIGIRQLDVNHHFGFWLPTRRSYIGGVLSVANQMSKRPTPRLAAEEGRFPFLDRDLIEFILSIPASQLLRPAERRSLMRRSLVGIVPQEVLSRRTKQLWTRTPVVTLRNNIKELEMYFEEPLSEQFGYINRIAFLEALRSSINGEDVHLVRLLKTVSLEMWLRDLASRHFLNLVAQSPDSIKPVAFRAST